MTKRTPEERFEQWKESRKEELAKEWPSTRKQDPRGRKTIKEGGWTEEQRKEHSERVKARWADPDNYERYCKAMSAGWTPEVRAAASKRLQARNLDPTEAMTKYRTAPKTEETKKRMSEAKLGKTKSPEHVANMKAAHSLRSAILREIQQEKGCTHSESCKILKRRKAYYYDKYGN